MLLAVHKVDAKSFYINGLDEYFLPKNKYYAVWNTDTMEVGEPVDINILCNETLSGDLCISNLRKPVDGVHPLEQGTTCNSNIFPFKRMVELGCGDIWYGGYVWNAHSGCMYKINDGIFDIEMHDGYYVFMHIKGWESVPYARFLIKASECMVSGVSGDSGERISRTSFISKCVLGTL